MFPNFTCPNDACAQVLTTREVGTTQEPPKVNDILLCGSCGTIAVVTTEGTCREMGQVEFILLPKQERDDLDFARRAIQAHVARNNKPRHLR